MIRRPPRSTLSSSSAASDVYKRQYVTNSYSDTVSVINTENNTVIATLDVGPYPVGIVINPAGTKLYVAHDHSDIFSIINTNTNNILLHVNYGTDPFALGKFIGLLPVQVYPVANFNTCLLYTSPSPRDRTRSRMPSS